MTNLKGGKININVFASRIEMGRAAGAEVENTISELLRTQPEIRMIFAAAPSQNELLDYLTGSDIIEWGRVTAFNMDEYIGLEKDAPESFAHYLNEQLFSKVNCKNVYLIDTSRPIQAEIERYSALITQAPIDIVCLGIGENGHIAFNDPPVARFKDSEILKRVKLDDACRMQQVNEGCFKTLNLVPETALTLTIPVIMKAKHLFCVVPGSSKRKAVFYTLNYPVSESCPASILQEHPDCSFYFDEEAYQLESSEQS